MTEREVGSDATSIQCKATKVEGGYYLNGNKRWIGIATHSDLIVTFAKDDSIGKIKGFLVETKNSPGLWVAKIE